MKFGVRDGVLRQTWDESFGEAAWLGFDGVELDIPARYQDSLLWSDEGRMKLLRYAEGSGVEIAAFCLGALWTISPADEDPYTQKRAVAFMQQAIRNARAVDCSVILVPITPGENANPDLDVQLARWLDALKQCFRMAEREGVTLALENVYKGCGQSAQAILHMIQDVSSPSVKAYYDFGNALILGQDPVQEMRLLGRDNIRQLHAKDPGAKRLGEGKVPFPEVVKTVRELGYDGYIVLETDPTDDPTLAAGDNLHFLQRVFS